MFSTDFWIDTLKQVVLAALVAGAALFVAAPRLDTETFNAVWAAGIAAGIAALKSIVAAVVNGGSATLVRPRVLPPAA